MTRETDGRSQPAAPILGGADLPAGVPMLGRPPRGGDGEQPPEAAQKPRWSVGVALARRRDKIAAPRLGVTWTGGRRAFLVRRVLGLLATMALLFLAVQVGGKPGADQVRQIVDDRISQAGADAPIGDAVLYAAPIVKLFATYDTATAQMRSGAIAPYIVGNIDPKLGWNGEGKQTVLDMVLSPTPQIAGPNVLIVHSTVQIQDGSWRCVAVPLYWTRPAGGARPAFSLTQVPVYESCGGRTVPQASSAPAAGNDSALANTLATNILPAYLAAWAGGDKANLDRFLLPGVTSFGLAGAFSGSGPGSVPVVSNVYVPVVAAGQDANRRTVQFQVTFLSLDGKATQTSTYQVPIAFANSQWFIAGDPAPTVDRPGSASETLPDTAPGDATGLFPTPSVPVSPSSSSSATPSPGVAGTP